MATLPVARQHSISSLPWGIRVFLSESLCYMNIKQLTMPAPEGTGKTRSVMVLFEHISIAGIWKYAVSTNHCSAAVHKMTALIYRLLSIFYYKLAIYFSTVCSVSITIQCTVVKVGWINDKEIGDCVNKHE